MHTPHHPKTGSTLHTTQKPAGVRGAVGRKERRVNRRGSLKKKLKIGEKGDMVMVVPGARRGQRANLGPKRALILETEHADN